MDRVVVVIYLHSPWPPSNPPPGSPNPTASTLDPPTLILTSRPPSVDIYHFAWIPPPLSCLWPPPPPPIIPATGDISRISSYLHINRAYGLGMLSHTVTDTGIPCGLWSLMNLKITSNFCDVLSVTLVSTAAYQQVNRTDWQIFDVESKDYRFFWGWE